MDYLSDIGNENNLNTNNQTENSEEGNHDHKKGMSMIFVSRL